MSPSTEGETMRKMAGLAMLCALVLVAVSCGKGGKYADVKPVLNKQSEMMESFAAQVEKATNGKEAAAALDSLAGKQEKLMAKMKALSEKYPEMKSSTEPPEELKEEIARLEPVAAKFSQAMMTVMQKYGNDPAVQEAMKKMSAMRME